MKKSIALIIATLMIGSLYAAKAEKNLKLTTELQDIIERELNGNKTNTDIISAKDNTKISDGKRIEGKS